MRKKDTSSPLETEPPNQVTSLYAIRMIVMFLKIV